MIIKTDLKTSLNAHKIAPLKRFGQNFLIDRNVRDRIIRESSVASGDICLEIGPGAGALTEALCEAAARVVAVEIDQGLYQLLKETLDYDNLTLIHGDILKKDIHNTLKTLLPDPFKLIANLPYYITTPILMMFLTGGYPVTSITVMAQKEVADRLCAAPGSKAYGSLSIAAQLYADIRRLFTVPRECFFPSPDVESAVIQLTLLENFRVTLPDEKLFFSVVHAGFSNRRKTLVNCLTASGMTNRAQAEAALKSAGIDPSRRGETLSVEEYAALTEEIVSKSDRRAAKRGD